MSNPYRWPAPRPFGVPRRVFTGIVMRLAKDEGCENCEFAIVDGNRLRLGEQQIPRDPKGRASLQANNEPTDVNSIHVKWDDFTVEQIMNSAWLAARDVRYLALHF